MRSGATLPGLGVESRVLSIMKLRKLDLQLRILAPYESESQKGVTVIHARIRVRGAAAVDEHVLGHGQAS